MRTKTKRLQKTKLLLCSQMNGFVIFWSSVTACSLKWGEGMWQTTNGFHFRCILLGYSLNDYQSFSQNINFIFLMSGRCVTLTNTIILFILQSECDVEIRCFISNKNVFYMSASSILFFVMTNASLWMSG